MITTVLGKRKIRQFFEKQNSKELVKIVGILREICQKAVKQHDFFDVNRNNTKKMAKNGPNAEISVLIEQKSALKTC